MAKTEREEELEQELIDAEAEKQIILDEISSIKDKILEIKELVDDSQLRLEKLERSLTEK